MALSRRTLLLASAAAAGAATAGAASAASAGPAKPDDYPFTLGIASGDPDHEGFVLWTRLAVNPLAEDDPTSRTVGTELVCSSITSGGNGADSNPADSPSLQINPHIKFFNNQRGYVMTRITQRELTADFKVVPVVTTAGPRRTPGPRSSSRTASRACTRPTTGRSRPERFEPAPSAWLSSPSAAAWLRQRRRRPTR